MKTNKNWSCGKCDQSPDSKDPIPNHHRTCNNQNWEAQVDALEVEEQKEIGFDGSGLFEAGFNHALQAVKPLIADLLEEERARIKEKVWAALEEDGSISKEGVDFIEKALTPKL
jgi:hypothetical protein